MEAARPAVRADGERCAELCQQALDALAHVRGGPLFSRRETGLVAKALLRPGGLDRLLADGRRRVLVGTVDATVVARGVGVGAAMVDDLVRWFSTSRCRGIDVTALPGDRQTKNFLEGSGFKARLLTMHRLLD